MSIDVNNLISIDPTSLAEGQRVVIIDGVAHASGVGGISGASGGSTDLSSITVTADKILDGYIAIDSTGTQITGTIPTISDITLDGRTIIVDSGYTGDDGFSYDLPEALIDIVDGRLVVQQGYVEEDYSEDLELATVERTSNSISISVGYVAEPIEFVAEGGGGGSGSSSGFKLTCSSDSDDVQRTTDGDYMPITESELPEWLLNFRHPGTAVYKRTEFCSVLDSDLYLACSQDEGDYYWYIVSCGLDDDASPCGVITDLNSQTLVAGDFSMYSMIFDEDTAVTVEQIGGGGSGGYTKDDVIKSVLIFG